MPLFSFFKSTHFLHIKQILQEYCQEMQYQLDLSDQEIMQLSWHLQGSNLTPEARTSNLQYSSLHFEIQRSLSRVHSLELLRRGDDNAYQAFIQDQNKAYPLSKQAFEDLSKEFQSLSHDAYAVIRASCFLTITDTAKRIFLANKLKVSNDSEEFLTDFSKFATKYPLLMPITSQMTSAQLKLLKKVYWPNMHFRHMLYTEGGNNMTKTFQEGINLGKFSMDDFVLWKWRWLTNLFGFQGGRSAKFYNQSVHDLTYVVFEALESSIKENKNFLETYLDKRALLSNLTQNTLSIAEQQFVAHLLCFFHQTQCSQTMLGEQVLAGYQSYKASRYQNGSSLADWYNDFRQDSALLTPTYVPAIANNVYHLLMKIHNLDEKQSIQKATQFMCKVSEVLLRLPRENRISCFLLSKEDTLKPMLEKWLVEDNALQFELRDNQLILQEQVPLESKMQMRL